MSTPTDPACFRDHLICQLWLCLRNLPEATRQPLSDEDLDVSR